MKQEVINELSTADLIERLEEESCSFAAREPK
jgi:hypothetical protein